MTTTFPDLAASYMDTAEKLLETRRLSREAADEHQSAAERLAALTASLTMEAQPLGTNPDGRKAALEGLKAESGAYRGLASTVREYTRSLAQLDAGAELLGHTLRALRLRMEWEITTAHRDGGNGVASVAEMIERR